MLKHIMNENVGISIYINEDIIEKAKDLIYIINQDDNVSDLILYHTRVLETSIDRFYKTYDEDDILLLYIDYNTAEYMYTKELTEVA